MHMLHSIFKCKDKELYDDEQAFQDFLDGTLSVNVSVQQSILDDNNDQLINVDINQDNNNNNESDNDSVGVTDYVYNRLRSLPHRLNTILHDDNTMYDYHINHYESIYDPTYYLNFTNKHDEISIDPMKKDFVHVRDLVEYEIDKYVHNVMNYNVNYDTHPHLVLPKAPSTIKEALSLPYPDNELWWDSIMTELRNIDSYGTFADADQYGHAMKTKMVFVLTINNDYTIKRKSRLVTCGYSQVYGRDYMETYSPTTSVLIINILLSIAGKRKLVVSDFDVGSAFLEGVNDFVQYCRVPVEMSPGDYPYRLRIIKSLYGEKQAPKLWNERLNEILISIGLLRCPVEACMYLWKKDNEYLYLVIHVDDGLVTATSLEFTELFISEFKKHIHKVKLFYPIQRYLGMTIDSHSIDHKIVLSQSEYIDDLKLYDSYKKTPIPMSPHYNLRIELPNPNNDSLLPVTGKLRFITDRTRPDILVSVGEISTGGAEHPSDNHINVAKQIYSYLKSTPTKCLILGGNDDDCNLFGFCDASYVTTGTCKSRIGGCVYDSLDSGSIYSFSKNDTTVSHSSTESEIKALDELIKVMIHIDNIRTFIGYIRSTPMTIYCDSKSSINLVNTLKSTTQTRHINMRINFIRQCINDRTIQIIFIPTELNVADILTKPLPKHLFQTHCDKLLSGFNNEPILSKTTLYFTYLQCSDQIQLHNNYQLLFQN